MLKTFKAMQELKEMLNAKGIAFKESTHYAQASAEVKRILDDYEQLAIIGKNGKVCGYVEALKEYSTELFNVYNSEYYGLYRRTFLQTEVKATADYIGKLA